MISVKNRRKGFTVIEMSVATGLMTLLAVILSSSWRDLGRATVDLIARVQLAQEMDYVAASLSRDLGGCMADKDATATFPFSSWSVNTSDPNNNSLTISVGDTDSHKITYRRDTSNTDPWKRNNLVRIYAASDDTEISRFTVARNVDNITLSSDSNTLTMTVDFSCNYRPSDPAASDSRTQPIVKRTCVFVVGKPST